MINGTQLEYFRKKKIAYDNFDSYELSIYDATEKLNNKTGDYKPSLLKYVEKAFCYSICCHCGRTNPGSDHYSNLSTPFRFCSSRCASLSVKRHKAHARRVNTQTHYITNLELYLKDGGKCGVCDQPVEMSNASIDHIVAISKGGTHTWDNVQLAHYKCNILKGADEMKDITGPARLIQGAYLHSMEKEEYEAETEVIEECP